MPTVNYNARVAITWWPTTSLGLVTQRVEVYNQMNQQIAILDNLPSTQSGAEVMIPENAGWCNIYVYSLNSQGQGNAASTGLMIGASGIEQVPDAPGGLSASIVGWVAA